MTLKKGLINTAYAMLMVCIVASPLLIWSRHYTPDQEAVVCKPSFKYEPVCLDGIMYWKVTEGVVEYMAPKVKADGTMHTCEIKKVFTL